MNTPDETNESAKHSSFRHKLRNIALSAGLLAGVAGTGYVVRETVIRTSETKKIGDVLKKLEAIEPRVLAYDATRAESYEWEKGQIPQCLEDIDNLKKELAQKDDPAKEQVLDVLERLTKLYQDRKKNYEKSVDPEKHSATPSKNFAKGMEKLRQHSRDGKLDMAVLADIVTPLIHAADQMDLSGSATMKVSEEDETGVDVKTIARSVGNLINIVKPELTKAEQGR